MFPTPTRDQGEIAHAHSALTRRGFGLALGGALCGASLLAAAPRAFAAAKPWRLASAWPDDNYQTLTTRFFAEDFGDQMKGKQTIEVYSNGSLFAREQIANAVAAGQVELGEFQLVWLGDQLPVAEAASVPFLAVGYSEARALWLASRQTFITVLGRLNLFPVYGVPWPPVGLLSRYPLDDAMDLAGRRFLTTSGQIERFAEAVGAKALRQDPAQAMATFRQGDFDAAFVQSIEGIGEGGLMPPLYYYDVQAWLPMNVVLMNKALYEAQSTSTQEILIDAADRAQYSGWAASQQEFANRLAMLRARGVTVQQPSANLAKSLRDVGLELAKQWLARAGVDGQDLLRAYRS